MHNPNLWLLVGVVVVIAIVWLIQHNARAKKVASGVESAARKAAEDLRKKL